MNASNTTRSRSTGSMLGDDAPRKGIQREGAGSGAEGRRGGSEFKRRKAVACCRDVMSVEAVAANNSTECQQQQRRKRDWCGLRFAGAVAGVLARSLGQKVIARRREDVVDRQPGNEAAMLCVCVEEVRWSARVSVLLCCPSSLMFWVRASKQTILYRDSDYDGHCSPTTILRAYRPDAAMSIALEMSTFDVTGIAHGGQCGKSASVKP